MLYLDTSALLKLYIREPGSDVVQACIAGQDEPLPVWELQHFELINAVHLKVFWGDIDGETAGRLLDLFDQRMRRGQYAVPYIDRVALMDSFRMLSRQTQQTGCRTLDILHVACALQLGPTHFISFDDKQLGLAAQAGLHVLPEG